MPTATPTREVTCLYLTPQSQARLQGPLTEAPASPNLVWRGILQEVNPDAEDFTDSTIPESNPISSVIKEQNCFLPKECLSSIRSIPQKEAMAHSFTSTRLVVPCAQFNGKRGNAFG